MNKKAFTLIELLAVIVILAIIALIAVPIVLNIIEDSKNSSQKESIKLYLDTVDKYIAKENMKKKYNPDYCNIVGTGDLNCYSNGENLGTLVIEMNGKKLEDGRLYFSNGVITTGENIKLEGKFYQLEANGNIKEGYNDVIATYINKVKESVGNITGTCTIGTNKVTCNGTETTLGNGINATSGTIVFENGEVTSYKNVLINGTYYHERNGNKSTSQTEEYLCTKVTAASTTNITKGDKYACKVNATDTFNFYVLTDPADGKVNLIMDRNICNNGTVIYTEENNYCRYRWYSEANNNTYGPTTVMTELYEGTKNWINVPDMIMNYIDEDNNDSEDMGYTSILTDQNTKVTTITGKPITKTVTIGTSEKPLKARLPEDIEVNVAGCGSGWGSCPTWLMENMTYYNTTGVNGIRVDKYSMNKNKEAYQGKIEGYWLLSTYSNKSEFVRIVNYWGFIYNSWTVDDHKGARPVITVSTDDLSN